jgi:hypothetical protein
MKKQHNVGEGTFRTVRGRYQDWFGAGDRGSLPGRAVSSEYYDYPDTDNGGGEMGKTVFMALGGGIGLVLLALAALSFVTAGRWAEIDRDGAMTGYLATGFALLIAGSGAIVATWNHLFRASHGPAHH